MKLCYRIEIGPIGAIELHQRGPDRFRVTYGRQVKDELTYSQAALELGADIMHWLACDAKLDNRERGERR